MKILVAEDDPVSRKVIEILLIKNKHDPVLVDDGFKALELLGKSNSPDLALLDWMMPGLEGVEVCREIRRAEATKGKYLIMVTARDRKEDLIAALDAGADDYLVKPINQNELFSRIRVGERVLNLQKELRGQISMLRQAKSTIKQLNGLIPICSYCKKIRSDEDYWEQVETFISNHSELVFSHSICPSCYEKIAAKSIKAYKEKKS